MLSRFSDNFQFSNPVLPKTFQLLAATIILMTPGSPALFASNTDSQLLELIQMGALTGDLRPASELVNGLDESTEDEVTKVLAQQYRARFLGGINSVSSSSNNSLVDAAAAIYRGYWQESLVTSVNQQKAQQTLRKQLAELLSNEYSQFEAGMPIYQQLEEALSQQNLGVSVGNTPPLRDLYIWKTKTHTDFQVELTDGTETVTVTFITDPWVQGWQHYASLGLAATSGWATADGLYCLCWSYDLESEAFKVSWLKHETRHLVDFREFPGLSEMQMEYRAKLTELAFTGNNVSSLLRQFANSSSNDSESAHAMANYQVSHDIYREIFLREMPEHLDPWQLLGPERVGPAARKLLQRNSDSLRMEATGAP